MQTATLRRAVLPAVMVLALGLAGCATDAPAVPLGPDGEPDPVLALGRDVYASRCSNCHGSSGGGGTGPRLAGVVEEEYPDPAEQRLVVREGRGNMPSFGGTLSEGEIDAVVRYTREVLG